MRVYLDLNFDVGWCSKTALKLAVSRIKLLKNKREAHVKQLRRELAQLLQSGHDHTATIRVILYNGYSTFFFFFLSFFFDFSSVLNSGRTCCQGREDDGSI